MKPSSSKVKEHIRKVIPMAIVATLIILYPTRRRKPRSGQIILDGKFLIYATYSENGQLREDEIEFLQDALEQTWNCIVVNNGEPIESQANIGLHKIYNRINHSRDLGAYSHVINNGSQFRSEVIFANSSMIWSSNSFTQVLEEIRGKQSDVVFLTQSLQTFEHGQSYFSWFSEEAVARDAHLIAFGSVRKWSSKRLLVWNEELPILKRLRQNGFKVDFVVKYQELVDIFLATENSENLFSPLDYIKIKELCYRGINLNPSIHFAAILFSKYGVYKRVLLENPAKMENSLFFYNKRK